MRSAGFVDLVPKFVAVTVFGSYTVPMLGIDSLDGLVVSRPVVVVDLARREEGLFWRQRGGRRCGGDGFGGFVA